MDGSSLSPNDLAAVDDVTALLELLQDKLGWDLGAEDVEDLDDVTYDWGPEELALKPEHRAKLREIKQLRPFESDQGWAVFFVSFESEGRLPVTVLRRVLRALTLRGRNASTDRSAWNLHDLLFISAFGKGAERELAFAHFHDEPGGDLPRLSVLGWDEADTDRRKALTADRLQGLSYEPGEDADARRERWRAVFRGTKRQAIRDSKTLAKELAGLAAAIRDRVDELIDAEDETGHLRRMHAAFQRTLIEGLSADEFADTFAQTVAYGLLTAAFSRPSGALVMQDLVHMVPPTNPFLRGLFERFLHMGGQDRGNLLDYDELGLREVIDLLDPDTVDLEAVKADFDSRRQGEDPVIFLYEDFLQHYNAALRMKRGVYYTPRAVVGFIVRGMDRILRDEFGLRLGLADTSTWGEVAARIDAVKVPEGVDPSEPFVRILDPATGTGTFLVEVIDLIEKTMKAEWAGETEVRRRALWQDYVERHLLPRLMGFELMMAPYAIAHMKVGLKLSDTGFVAREGIRLRIYLTNALEPPRDFDRELDFMFEALAQEAQAANGAKATPVTVVIGNPPYAGYSANMRPIHRALVARARRFNGAQITERNALQFEVNINDDYVKFTLAYTGALIDPLVCAFVTNADIMRSSSLRGVREHLATRGMTRFLNLHGAATRGASGQDDENVFDIVQPVCIWLHTRDVGSAGIASFGMPGPRSKKTAFLENAASRDIRWVPQGIDEGGHLSDARSVAAANEFLGNASLRDVFERYSEAVKTGRDAIVVDFEAQELVARMRALRCLGLPEAEAVASWDLTGKKSWDRLAALRSLRARDPDETIVRYTYRAFDERRLFKDRRWVSSSAPDAMSAMGEPGSIALAASSMSRGEPETLVHCATEVFDKGLLSSVDNVSCFPLFVRDSDFEPRRPNVAPAFARSLAQRIGLPWVDGLPRASSKGGQFNMDALAPLDQPDLMDQGAPPDWDGRVNLVTGFGPRDLFDFIYAVLHAPSYRTRYAEFLRSDFPRIPLPGGTDPAGLFRALAVHGRRLSALHLLNVDVVPELRAPAIRLAGTGSKQLGKATDIHWKDGKVWINGERWFETVPEAAWTFRIGGYQPAQKWLKDRAGKGGTKARDGRVLTEADVLHYRRFVTAMQLTISEMAVVDATIEAHGGWPDAFAAPNG